MLWGALGERNPKSKGKMLDPAMCEPDTIFMLPIYSGDGDCNTQIWGPLRGVIGSLNVTPASGCLCQFPQRRQLQGIFRKGAVF